MDKKLKDENLKIAIQKDGRLTNESIKTLRSMGIEFEIYNRKLFAISRDFPIEILFCRDDDIPGYVESGVADVGIVGQNIIQESKSKVAEIIKPGFGHCNLSIAVPKESKVSTAEELRGKRIATSFPSTAQQYFSRLNIPVDIITISGSVEITPALGVSDAIVDIVASGSTLTLNDLRQINVIAETEAVLIRGNKKLSGGKENLLLQMIARLEAVLAAKNMKYVMMNAPKDSLGKIKQIAPGLNAPTVTELTKPDWIAIHAVMNENAFWSIADELKILGACDILVLPIEKVVV